MKKIRYNLAAGKKINNRVYIALLLFFFIGALLLSALAVHSLGVTAKKIESAKLRSQQHESDRTALARSQAALAKLLAEKKPAWQARIDFCNRLIDRKAFSFCTRLDFLEKILPPETFVERLAVQNDQSPIHCALTAGSFVQVIDTYRMLSTHGMTITSEYEKDGAHHLVLSVQYKKDDKK